MNNNNYQYHPQKDEDPVTNTNDTNNILIWLDEEALNSTSPDSRLTIDMFKSIANTDYKLYNSLELFLPELENMTKTARIMVITSGLFAQRLLPQLSLSLLRELSSIIIFCKDSTNYKDLLKKYRKVIDICTDEQFLKEAIQDELNRSTNFAVVDRDLNHIFNLKVDAKNFNLYKRYIEIVKDYPWPSNNRQKMIDECIEHYRKSVPERKKIEEFRDSYTPETAIRWYTRDSFLYRLVNKALRSLNMEQIMIYQFYIRDLCTQLEHLHKQNQSDTPLIVFRGYGNMTVDQYKAIEKSIDGFISFNGFLSTTTDYQVAVMYAGSLLTQNKSVLFEIRTNYNSKNVVFADISQLSNLEDEREVLFSLCSIFRIDAITYDEENQLSKIIMSTTNEDIVNKLEQVDIEINQDEGEHCLSCINQYCRRHKIVAITFSIIIIMVLGIIFSIGIKLKDRTQSSYNCVGANCTTLNTTTGIVHFISLIFEEIVILV